MSEVVQGKLGHAIIHKDKAKYKDKKTGEDIIYRCILDLPIDEPLCEIIEEFGIPIFRKKGLNYKIRYIARTHLQKKLDVKQINQFRNIEKKLNWIHNKEVLTKKEYNTQKKGLTELTLSFRGSLPILYSLGDAIQILSKLETDEKRGKLIRKLIIKIEELQKRLNKQEKEEIDDLRYLLEQLDIVCYDWIKEHQESVIYKGREVFGNFAGFIRLWDHELWQMIIDIRYKIRQNLGLPVPKKENAGLHHLDRPYRIVYPHVATKGQIIDKRWDHDDPRQKRFI